MVTLPLFMEEIMNKQDCNGVRNAQDLERKYDFASLLGLKKNIEIQAKSLVKLNNELNNILNTLIINLKDVLDSQNEVSLWFYNGVPTTSNKPYTDWTNPAEHYGDIYYDKTTGYVYQFYEVGWQKNEDYNLIQAMALTNTELDTSSNFERKVFFEQPTPPYTSGDWWIKDDGTLFICQLGKVSGLNYEENDFIISSKYTTTIAVKQNEEITVLKGTVTQISENYVKITDLATGGSTTIAGENITTGSIKSKNYVQNSKGMKINLENGTIDTKNTKWDEYGNIKLSNGATIITDKGLMSNLQFYGNNGKFVILGMDYNEMNNEFQKYNISIYADIPENFTIEKAYITIIHQPCLWNDANYGYTRNIAIYKATLDSKFESDWRSDFSLETENTLTQLTKIFSGDKNIWQPSTPSSSNSKIEVKQTIDISSYLAKGLNKFIIQTSDNLPTPGSDYNTNLKTAMQRSGRGIAVIDIYGFIKV